MEVWWGPLWAENSANQSETSRRAWQFIQNRFLNIYLNIDNTYMLSEPYKVDPSNESAELDLSVDLLIEKR